ncbi:hypothetical protein Moror_9235 [Moniliophthora roreri MCA 2997]|uniref:Uncharacterized protein n=1 Tax=Moniliophthora roreri (strain MCA 2997) TaxID=1381753 RepID=V2WDP5_MONRO|nr:hypothetical protein Moror_9235 [Moniliophthora roreri MCA 2997]
MHLGKDAKDRPNRLLYLAWTIVLFVLAILANTFESWDYIHAAIVSFVAAKTKEYEPFTEYATSYQLKTIRNSIIVLLAPLINITADSMLIHRCYIIWGSLRRVAFPLIFGSFVVNALGITSIVVMTKGQLDTSIESNLALLDKGITLNNGYVLKQPIPRNTKLIELLAAGRIWWITRQARQLMDQGIDHKYKTIVAIILESGILYPTAIVIYLIIVNTLYHTNTAGIPPVDFYPVVWQAAGIAQH